MKRLLVFMLLAVLIISCSSKKKLSVRKIAHNGVINNIASQYDFSQKQYSTLNNSKNSSAKNLLEVEGRITPVKNNQDFLASKDKVESSVLTTKYSHKELPHFIQQEKINKSFLGEVPILKHKEITKKKSKTKDKQYKTLFILLFIMSCIVAGLMLTLAFFLYLLSLLILAIVSLLTGILIFFLGFWSFIKPLKKKGGRARGLY